MLILYFASLLNSFISSDSFLVDSLGFSKYKIMPSVNRDSFHCSFPIWMIFVSVSYLIALARISSTMLNESGKRGHSCLVPHFRGKSFILSLLSMMLAAGFS